MQQTIQLFRRQRLLIGQDLNEAKVIFDRGEQLAKATDLERLGNSAARRFGVLAGLFFALRESLSPADFSALLRTLDVPEYEATDLLNTATDSDR